MGFTLQQNPQNQRQLEKADEVPERNPTNAQKDWYELRVKVNTRKIKRL